VFGQPRLDDGVCFCGNEVTPMLAKFAAKVVCYQAAMLIVEAPS